jgi:hypothetical protein
MFLAIGLVLIDPPVPQRGYSLYTDKAETEAAYWCLRAAEGSADIRYLNESKIACAKDSISE